MISSDALHSDARHADSEGWTPQLWGILFVLGGALCLDGLDVSMVGVALPFASRRGRPVARRDHSGGSTCPVR